MSTPKTTGMPKACQIGHIRAISNILKDFKRKERTLTINSSVTLAELVTSRPHLIALEQSGYKIILPLQLTFGEAKYDILFKTLS